MLLVPSNAHALFARPLVISPESRVALEVSRPRGRGRAGLRRAPHHRAAAGLAGRGRARRNPVLLARLRVQPFTDRLVRKFELPGAGLARPDALSVGPTRAPSTPDTDRSTMCSIGSACSAPRRRGPLVIVRPVLAELRIQALGVIEDATLDLHPGLTVVTGETGAGQDDGGHRVAPPGRWPRGLVARPSRRRAGHGGGALPAAHPGRGGRRGRTTRGEEAPDGEPRSAVRLATDAGAALDDDGSLIAARTVSADGRSRAHLGGRSVPMAVLSDVTDAALAVHGQHEALRLLRASEQRAVLDRFAGRRRRRAARRLPPHADGVAHGDHRADPAPRAGPRAHPRGGHAAPRPHRDRVRSTRSPARTPISSPRPAGSPTRTTCGPAATGGARRARGPAGRGGGGAGRGGAAGRGPAARAGRATTRRSPGLDPRLAEAAALLGDAAAELTDYLARLEADPQRLEQVLERQADLKSLTRKYAADVDGVLEWADEAARERLAGLDTSDEALAALAAEAEQLAGELAGHAAAVSAARREAADRFGAAVSAELDGLAMGAASVAARGRGEGGRRPPTPQALEVDGRRVVAGPDGVDEVELLLTPHAGAPPLPVHKGASGGELSRVMLAVEVVLAGADTTPTLVFDEVDAGVGGRAAVEVGRRLARLAATHQVVVVTHLAQVAAYADRHLVVDKGGLQAVTGTDEHGSRAARSARSPTASGWSSSPACSRAPRRPRPGAPTPRSCSPPRRPTARRARGRRRRRPRRSTRAVPPRGVADAAGVAGPGDPGRPPGASAPHIRPLRRRSEAWVVAVARGGGHEVATGTHQGRDRSVSSARRASVDARAARSPRSCCAGSGRGDVAVIDQVDLDRATAHALVDAGVAGVVNVSPSISGRYPNLGPEILTDAGVALVDDVGEGVLRRVRDGAAGAPARRRGLPRRQGGRPRVLPDRRDGRRPARGGPLGAGLAARGVLGEHHRVHGAASGRCCSTASGVPGLETALHGRTVLVVAPGRGPRRRAAAPASTSSARNARCWSASAAGAEALREAGHTPVVVVGTALEIDPELARKAVDVVIPADLDGHIAGLARLQDAGVDPVGFPSSANPEDMALLLAHRHGASLVVACGFDATLTGFLDRGRSGSNPSTVLTRLRLGPTLVDGAAVGVAAPPPGHHRRGAVAAARRDRGRRRGAAGQRARRGPS